MRDTVRSGGTQQAEDAVPMSATPRRGSSPRQGHDLIDLPIGMFDSGIGGLTVLHECLVALPAEDFIYVGDTARFPYGSKSQDQLQAFAQQITAFLEHTGVKLIVVACYSATAAALPALQECFETPIVGIVTPGARAAVQSSRYRRIGVMATEATVASGSYVRAIHSLDAGAEVHQQSCPGLAAFIQDGDVYSQELVAAVRSFTSPLKDVHPDVVIMGCTHYPLIAPMLQRHLGRDVSLVNPAAEIAVEVEEILVRQGVARSGEREGQYRFLCTGEVEAFRSVGARFLQMPLEHVERIPLERLEQEIAEGCARRLSGTAGEEGAAAAGPPR